MLQIVCLCVIGSLLGGVTSSPDERRLLAHLFKDYDQQYGKYTRPVARNEDALAVTHGLTLLSIDMLDPFLDRAIVNIWQNTQWNDYALQWDPSAYGGITSIRVPVDKIYSPDITIWNEERPSLKSDVLAVINSDGGVMVVQPSKSYVSCQMEKISWHDKLSEINCSIKFGSWTYDGNKIDPSLQTDKIDVSHYLPYFGFDLIGTSAKKNTVKYDCCPESYIDLQYTMTFRRAKK